MFLSRYSGTINNKRSLMLRIKNRAHCFSVFAKNTCSDLAIGAKTVGSNFFLTDRQLSLNYNQGFAELCAFTPAQSQLSGSLQKSLSVPGTGVEPAHPFGHYHLKVACIPFHHPGLIKSGIPGITPA